MRTSTPALAIARQGDIWPGRYSDIDAAWRTADWCTKHYAGAPFRVIDIRTGELTQRKAVAA
jgi:hypothetical protein